jgi:hypothetical protein
MKKLISVLVLCLAAQAASALEVTGVAPAQIKGAAKGDFSFGPITVKSVAWEQGAVVMPLTDNKGKKYANIKLLSKGAYSRLEACFTKGFVKPAKAPARPAVKVDALKPLKSPARVANAELSFDGDLLVVAGVMASRKEEGTFWVAFPPDLEFTDAAFKSAVESAVIAAWTKKK